MGIGCIYTKVMPFCLVQLISFVVQMHVVAVRKATALMNRQIHVMKKYAIIALIQIRVMAQTMLEW